MDTPNSQLKKKPRKIIKKSQNINRPLNIINLPQGNEQSNEILNQPKIENPLNDDEELNKFMDQIENIHQSHLKKKSQKIINRPPNIINPPQGNEHLNEILNKPNIQNSLNHDEELDKFMDQNENIQKKKIKEEKKICNGRTATGNNCTRETTTNDSDYCKSHQYFDTFTELQIGLINSGQTPICRKCKKYKFDDTKTCLSCLTESSTKSAIIRENNPISRDNKCIEVDRENNPCRNNKLTGINYCKYHEYLNGVSPEERAKFTMCDRCKKYRNCNGKTNCTQCSSDLQQYQKNRQNDVICKGNLQTKKECSFQALPNEEFCGNHINYSRVYKEAKATNTKICSVFGHYKNCGKFIPINSQFNTCQACRDYDRNK